VQDETRPEAAASALAPRQAWDNLGAFAGLAAAREISRILDAPPVAPEDVLRQDARITKPWKLGALHATHPGLPSHVIMTYYGAGEQEISWRTQGKRHFSRTRAGTITLVPDGHGGRWDIEGPIEVSHVYLPDARLQAAADLLAAGKRIELIGRVAVEDPAAARVMQLLSHEAGLAVSSSLLFIEQALDLLCLQLVRAHSSASSLAIAAPRRGLADWQVKKVMTYMRAHLDEDISLDDLAALVSLSRFHFCTAFRLATGRTPHEWLVGQRIGRSRMLLIDRSLSITEIGMMVGYQTPSSFAAAFHRQVGVSPSEFRRRL
jgi:AraC family transcriptional regulator